MRIIAAVAISRALGTTGAAIGIAVVLAESTQFNFCTGWIVYPDQADRVRSVTPERAATTSRRRQGVQPNRGRSRMALTRSQPQRADEAVGELRESAPPVSTQKAARRYARVRL